MINDKILIVDDEPDICDLISDILIECGYSVKSAFIICSLLFIINRKFNFYFRPFF